MQGNIFICLNEATYKGFIPTELEGQYARKTYDEEGLLLSVLNTTFEEVGEDNRVKYGSVIELEINTERFFILEFESSWLEGSVSSLLALGSGLLYPNNTMLNNREAIALVSANTKELL